MHRSHTNPGDEVCPVCGGSMHQGLKSWHWQCSRCEYQKADFKPAINDSSAHQAIDERHREVGLRPLRVGNFQKLMEAILQKGPSSGSLLDVGCAHGWFLEMASSKFSVLGIEPDMQMYGEANKLGLPVRQGFFPDVLGEDESFDVIVFNDVFEHIPDAQKTLASCRAHLRSDGLLVLNLPSSTGFFYKLSRLLCRLGLSSCFERLWQKALPSPHLHYFHSGNLVQLLRSNGFEVVGFERLSTVKLKGLYTRISYTSSHSLPLRLLIFFGVALALPILRILPNDILCVLSRKARPSVS